MTEEKLYTLPEARRELHRRECRFHGHDIDVVYSGLSADPVKVVCGRCGESWDIQPKETA